MNMLPTLLPADLLKACYADDYIGAHNSFKQHVCDRHENSRYREFVYREKGPLGEKLLTSVAWLGRADASKVLVIQSATHGVEGFAGSAIQVDNLEHWQSHELPNDMAVLYIHAINPYGFAWLRRVNEQGIDLNRNFVDFNKALPDNPGYRELALALLPETEQAWSAADNTLETYRQQHGQVKLEEAISAGQYEFANGLFYGGQAASQSRLYMEAIFAEFELAKRQQVAVIDIHTGLGPFAYGEIICDHAPGSKAVAWAKRVYGQSVTEPAMGTSSSVVKQGLIDYFWQQRLTDRVCFVTLEFGTYSVARMFDVLRQDHFLHCQVVNWNEAHTQQVKQAMREQFYPATADWQEMVLLRGRQVISQAIQGLLEI